MTTNEIILSFIICVLGISLIVVGRNGRKTTKLVADTIKRLLVYEKEVDRLLHQNNDYLKVNKLLKTHIGAMQEQIELTYNSSKIPNPIPGPIITGEVPRDNKYN